MCTLTVKKVEGREVALVFGLNPNIPKEMFPPLPPMLYIPKLVIMQIF